MLGRTLGLGLALAIVLGAPAFGLAQGYLGIFGEDGDQGHKGAVVKEVLEGSPAEEAGLHVGDLILAVGEDRITSFEDLAKTINSYSANETISIEILRNGKEQELEVTLTVPPKTKKFPDLPFDFGPDGFRFRVPSMPGRSFRFDSPEPAKKTMIGIQLQPIDEALRNRLGLGDVQGVLIADVIPDSPAEKAGLVSTDVILEVDGQTIKDPQQLQDFVARLEPGHELDMKIVREGETLDKKIVVQEMAVIQPPRMPRDFSLPFPNGNGERFHGRMVPADRLEKMQKQIDDLKDKVEKLTRQLDQLKAISKEPDPTAEVFEYELGVFSDTNVSDPAMPLRIEYTVDALIYENMKDEFMTTFERRQQRIREAISIVIRDATYEELHEASLSKIKRKIKDMVSEQIGRNKPIVDSIIIPTFKPFEL